MKEKSAPPYSHCDPTDALHEIHRVLKPGGQFVFMEHTLDDNADSWRRAIQERIAPVWSIVGDGCAFRDVATELETELSSLMSLDIEKFEADFVPAAVAFVKPHLRGVATKLEQQSE